MPTERQLTARLADFFVGGRDVRIGIGDDAAVVRQHRGHAVLCCDPVVAGVHFDDADDLRLVGRKAVNRNLSDLAAMGAVPDWLLLSVIVPSAAAAEEGDLFALLAGVRRAADRAGARVVGGDLATSRGPLVVTVSAIGHLPGRALTRDAVRPNDTLHVTGPLGGSQLGHHLRFSPALREGVWLAKQRAVGGAIDVSDGLVLDLATMLSASGGLGAELDAARIPIRAAARKLAGGDRTGALQHALSDGEDHVLLWSQRPDTELAGGGPLSARARRPIGRVTAAPGLWLRDGGRRTPLSSVGFQHAFDPAHDRPRR